MTQLVDTKQSHFGNYLVLESGDIDGYIADMRERLANLECSPGYIDDFEVEARTRYEMWVADGKPLPNWIGVVL